MYNINEKQQFHLKIERSNINNNNVTLNAKGGLFYIHNSKSQCYLQKKLNAFLNSGDWHFKITITL